MAHDWLEVRELVPELCELVPELCVLVPELCVLVPVAGVLVVVAGVVVVGVAALVAAALAALAASAGSLPEASVTVIKSQVAMNNATAPATTRRRIARVRAWRAWRRAAPWERAEGEGVIRGPWGWRVDATVHSIGHARRSQVRRE
ncbi:MAG: hypothetical protein WCB67_06765 [Solirubrobacteraceae bacterium]